MRVSLANLQVEVVQHAKGQATGAVILCHGFGASGADLVPLAGELARRDSRLHTVRFYFPAAPIALGFGDARAWWNIDFDFRERLAQGARGWETFYAAVPEGMDVAQLQLGRLLAEVLAQDGLPMSRVVLGGFSQGAMVATDLALATDAPCGGLAILSGALVARERWTARAAARTTLRVLQAHGREDEILPLAAGEALRAMFAKAGVSVAFSTYPGGHAIFSDELDALAAFIAGAISG